MKYTYPAIFEPDEGKIGVEFPDVKGCITYGDDMADALEMAKDCLDMMLAHYEDEGLAIPPASDIRTIQTPHVVSYVLADTDEWRRQMDSRAVKKTLTLPGWLNSKAEKAGVNFSQVLQDALKKLLNVSAPQAATV